jgi:hypothetical protein
MEKSVSICSEEAFLVVVVVLVAELKPESWCIVTFLGCCPASKKRFAELRMQKNIFTLVQSTSVRTTSFDPNSEIS